MALVNLPHYPVSLRYHGSNENLLKGVQEKELHPKTRDGLMD